MKIYSKEYFLRKILECSEEELQRAKEQKLLVCHEDQIPKKEGFRSIVSIEADCELIRLQRKLLKNFLSKLPVSPSAKGFIKGCSYVDFLEAHIGHDYFLRLDIKDFFGSIAKTNIIASLEPFAEKAIIDDIIELCTWNGRLPQGFVTSPALSNLVFCRLDQRIRKYCRAYHKEMAREIFYTRYADDMLFSAVGFDFKKNKNFKRMISHILQGERFFCNESKTIFAQGEISLSGYVVNEDVHLSRKKLRNINEVLYQFDTRVGYGDKPFQVNAKNIDLKKMITDLNTKKMKKADGTLIQFTDVSSVVHYVAGYRSYLIQIARAEHGNTGYDKQIAKKIKKLELVLDYLSKSLEEA